MSLLDAGPETVTVYLALTTIDGEGNPVRVPDWDHPVTVPGCHVFPLDATELPQTGQRAAVRYRVLARAAPLSPWGAAEWRGQRFEIDGDPLLTTGPAHLRHVRATLKKAG
ncbi:hypothetical protein M8C13_06255 [Crossiella sp. SN42]|uniref:hypothetical protein n=1 Tax=Crossiella sp. SN42 TaxID=2944808 RepID=UPI00207CFC1C|nr:hypothetical protein [Crossiella sp. SN42]MCO1575362.1 hypothetical protein [Crossiella sp. SN42]